MSAEVRKLSTKFDISQLARQTTRSYESEEFAVRWVLDSFLRKLEDPGSMSPVSQPKPVTDFLSSSVDEEHIS